MMTYLINWNNMFTWIIENKAKIIDINNGVFTVEKIFDEVTIWQSIAHDGACMTVKEVMRDSYSFFAMEETFSRTNFSSKKVWDTFNLERCLQIGDRLDGHFVTGHIDTTATVKEILINDDESRIIWFSFDKKYNKLVIEKWSIAINWVSLTVVDISSWKLTVSLIPFTLEVTNLWDLKVSGKVNFEFDMIWKYVLNQNN